MSFAMRVLALYTRLVLRPRMAEPARARQTIAAPKKHGSPPVKLRKRHSVAARPYGNFTCYTVTPRGQRAEGVVIYLHGGAYISQIAPQHWQFISRLADSGLRAEVPLYGLAPQHNYREAYEFVTDVYREILRNSKPAVVTIMGDSAGRAWRSAWRKPSGRWRSPSRGNWCLSRRGWISC